MKPTLRHFAETLGLFPHAAAEDGDGDGGGTAVAGWRDDLQLHRDELTCLPDRAAETPNAASLAVAVSEQGQNVEASL
jgi:hypothetical protein